MQCYTVRRTAGFNAMMQHSIGHLLSEFHHQIHRFLPLKHCYTPSPLCSPHLFTKKTNSGQHEHSHPPPKPPDIPMEREKAVSSGKTTGRLLNNFIKTISTYLHNSKTGRISLGKYAWPRNRTPKIPACPLRSRYSQGAIKAVTAIQARGAGLTALTVQSYLPVLSKGIATRFCYPGLSRGSAFRRKALINRGLKGSG